MNEKAPEGLLAGLEKLATRVKEFVYERILPWAKENPPQAAVAAGVVTVGGLLFLGGSVIVNGVIAGSLVAVAAGILLYKLSHSEIEQGRQLYNFIVRYPLASDIALSAVALMLAPAGITGWISAAVCALLASIWLLGADQVPLVEDEPRPVLVPITVKQ